MNNTLSNRPFFVVGAERSGTTMLRLMLNESQSVLVPRETWFMIELMNALPLETPLSKSEIQQAFQIIVNHSRWKDMEIENSELLSTLERLQDPLLSDLIESIFSILLARINKIRWGDKTPEYVIEIDRLHKVFPNAQFIHIVRDARDVCLSLVQRRWRGGTLIQHSAFYWQKYVNKGISSGRKLPGGYYLEIHYEQLVQETESTLKKICKFLEIPYSKSMLFFYKSAEQNIATWEESHHKKTLRAPNINDINRWKREASFYQIIAVEAIAGNVMKLVNQKFYFKSLARIIPLTFIPLEKLFALSLKIRRYILNRYSPAKS